MSTHIIKYNVYNIYKEHIIPIFKMATNGIDIDVSIPPNDKYRYYHCYENTVGDLICNKVNNAGVLPTTNQNTKLLFVKKYIPEILDAHILKYKWMPSKVHIT